MRRLQALVIVAASVLAAGCPGPRDGAGGEATDKRLVIGAVLMQQDQFFRLNEKGMQEAAGRLGVDLRVQNAGGAIDKEATIVDTFVTQGVDAILISPLSSTASVPALERAHAKGIVVVAYNNALDATFPACAISSDQVSLGRTTGKAASAFIRGRLSGRARVALVGFASQLPEQGGARARGFKAEMDALKEVEIVAEQDAWEAPQAERVVSEIFAKSPDVVWAANEGGTVGAVAAVKNAGKAGTVAVFGTDVSVQLLDFLLADDDILHAVTAQRPFDMGKLAVESAVKAIRKEPFDASVVLPGVVFTRNRAAEAAAERERLVQASQ